MNLAMLGMWHTHADGIVRQVAEHPDEFSLVGFYDPDPARRRRAPQPLGATHPRLSRLRQARATLGQEKIDGVVVEGRVYENLRLARLALESGRPVMLEKPAGDDPTSTAELVDLAQRKHLHVQMIYLFRYMSAVQELLKRVRKDELGRIYMFRARLPKDLPSYSASSRSWSRYKGGMFFEMAGHVIDMMVRHSGPAPKVSPRS